MKTVTDLPPLPMTDEEGRATLSEHANGADRVTITYDCDVGRTVTNALGQVTNYEFDWVQGERKIIKETRAATATVPAATKTWTYDSNGFIASKIDWNGTTTNFVNDSRGLTNQPYRSLRNAASANDYHKLAPDIPAPGTDRGAWKDNRPLRMTVPGNCSHERKRTPPEGRQMEKCARGRTPTPQPAF